MSNIIFIRKKRTGITGIKYGLLYNFYAVVDARNLANTGWHIPTQAEFNALRTYIGGSTSGYKLREVGTTHWQSPNTGATNEYGFNAVGSGYRVQTTGAFSNILFSQILWTPLAYNATIAYYHCQLSYNSNGFSDGTIQKVRGMSVRLMKDSTTLTHGQTGTYTGNDGKIYRTICINGVEYLADNLAETKFRNGDTIPFAGANGINYTNAEWLALTTAALCPYNNDWSNVLL